MIRGEDYKKIPETYFIVLHRNDLFAIDIGWNEEITLLKRSDRRIYNGQHRIRLNGEWRGNSLQGELMLDMAEEDPQNMISQVLARRASYLKNEEGGLQEMDSFVREFYNAGKAEAIKDMVESLLLDGGWSIE